MAAKSPFDGYEEGKTYKALTRALTYALMSYMGVGLIAFFAFLSYIDAPVKEGRSTVGAVAMFVVILAAAVALHILHSKSPERKYTVVGNHSNSDGSFTSEVRYLDGTTDIHRHSDGFWKQLGGLTKAMATGK